MSAREAEAREAGAPVATYARRVAAPLERVWENVLDWEHLPFLHHESFCGIDCEEAGAWGWRARVRIPPRERAAELTLEVRIDRDAGVYHTRTLEGPGAGTEIATTLGVPDAGHTDVHVEFRVPGLAPAAARAVGAGYVRLYTRLWEQDEAMIVRRDALLAGRVPGPPRPGPRPPLALGAASALRARLPLVVDLAGDRFRVLEHEGRLLAHAVVCPHQGGPLDEAALEAGAVVCPWHGYRFDVASGLGPAGQRCRMPVRAAVEVDARGDARLVVT